MFDSISTFFNSSEFMPHGHCFLWYPPILWLHVVSDIGIALAYYLIPIVLFHLIRRREDMPYKKVFVAFSAFIFLCGTTHLLSVWVLWHPDYGVEGVVKFLTMIASFAGLIGLWVIVPRVLKMINPMESKQRASENRIRALVDNALDGLITINQKGLVESFNPACERIFGYTADEVIGKNIKMLMPEPYYSQHDTYLHNYLTTGKPKIIGTSGREVSGRRKDGSTFPMDLAVSAFELEDGQHFSGIIRDISVKRQTEENLEKSEAKLRQAQKMEAIGNLTGGMAHDFNNLLSIVIGNLDLLLERIKDSEVVQFAQSALDAALSGSDLTKRLLAFARQQPLQPQRIDINNLVQGITKLLVRTLGEDIQVSLSLSDNVWPVVADPAQLEAAIANLATNARDAMPHGGRLIIATANRSLDADYVALHADVAPGDYVMIEVTDSGVGIEPKILARIFEPFFTTKERGKGTGLGLSMVFGFMKQSGGHVNVYSEAGKGTTFRLYLPRTLAGKVEQPNTPALLLPTNGHETILVVEDNEDVRRVVVRQLHDLGYHVKEAENATAALEILTNDHIDLLFTDIVMPGKLNGLELAQMAIKRWPSLKVILTSGFPETKINGHGSPTSGLRLLSKPYRKEELAHMINETLNSKTD